ncbi:hypothetical protein Pla52n_47940 [Stieleria varia]|uniref:Uncharacterized protein n=1 Tax=Stieleria varia TaxID=2528005 RepID=A0A5C6AE78_9BACT|nr:hypothetical protein Pla52n_47940 [Stieleria varia]
MHNSSARGRIAEVNNMLSAPRSANSFDWSITTSTRDDQARLRQNGGVNAAGAFDYHFKTGVIARSRSTLGSSDYGSFKRLSSILNRSSKILSIGASLRASMKFLSFSAT